MEGSGPIFDWRPNSGCHTFTAPSGQRQNLQFSAALRFVRHALEKRYCRAFIWDTRDVKDNQQHLPRPHLARVHLSYLNWLQVCKLSPWVQSVAVLPVKQYSYSVLRSLALSDTDCHHSYKLPANHDTGNRVSGTITLRLLLIPYNQELNQAEWWGSRLPQKSFLFSLYPIKKPVKQI